jgi:Ca2+/Na+ antiporter
MIGMTVLAIALAYRGGGLTRREGASIIVLYAAFAVIVVLA